MLGDQRLPSGNKEIVPGLGVSGGQALLVYQRNYLPGGDPEKLGGKNNDMPGL